MLTVNGNANVDVRNPASFVSCDVNIVDVANEYVEPLAPTPRKPDVRLGSVSVPIEDRVDDEYANDPSVVDELENVDRALNVLAPEKVFASLSSVDDAAPASDVRNPASLLNHDRLIDDEAIVCTSPLLPVNAKPCVSDGKNRDDPNVDDAVENSPLNPMIVDVPL